MSKSLIACSGLILVIACLELMLATGGKTVYANDSSPDSFSRHDKNEVYQFPSCARLKGTCSRKGYREWQFEIIVCRQGRYYYRKEWSGNKDQGHRSITLVVDDFYGVWGQSWSIMGGQRGGGHAGPGAGKDYMAVGRNLWSPEWERLQENHKYVEEYEQVTKRQGLNIPLVIRWTDKFTTMPEKTTIYTIRQIELLDRFDTNFFDRMLKEHFSFAEDHFPKKDSATKIIDAQRKTIRP